MPDSLLATLSEARALRQLHKTIKTHPSPTAATIAWRVLWRSAVVLGVLGSFAACQRRRGSRGNRFYRNGEPRPGSSEAGLRRGGSPQPHRVAAPLADHERRRDYAGRRSDDGRFAATASVAGGSESVVIRRDDGSRLSFGDWARLLAADPEFARFFNSLLAASPYDAFYWECPPTSATTLDAVPYEHKTVRSRGFAPASPSDFSEHLREPCAAGAGVAAFPNLGRDAMLVAPCDAGAAPPEDGAPHHRAHPTLREKREARKDRDDAAAARDAAPLEAYGHVANFARLAPDGQRVAFWAKVGAVYEALVKQGRPVWLSTEGSGVPWLHVRMDSRPKYYHTREFKDWKPWSEPTPL